MTERRRPISTASAPGGVTRRALLGTAALGRCRAAGAPLARAAMRPSSAKEAAYVPQPNATQYVIAVGAASIDADGTQSVPAVL